MTPLFPLAPFLFALGALARAPSAQDESSAVKRLFSENCATCHGETGDGQGTTQLDRPARSFKDGGFSFGNTPEAIFRTLSVGIPGTPMPSFDLLREEDRRALAEYVITLGPPIEEVTVEETILAVRDRPLFVRGLLPPIAEGLPSHPRGLLVGTTDGMTFEYRVDDVRLLGVRQGDFVERTDWRGRGGTPLKPLGKVVVLIEGGKPEGTFELQTASGQEKLRARLSGTRVRGDAGSLEYHLVDARGIEVAHVEEAPRALGTAFGAGFVRRFVLTGGRSACQLWANAPEQSSPGQARTRTTPLELGRRVTGHLTLVDEASRFVAVSAAKEAEESMCGTTGEVLALFALAPGERLEVEITTLLLTESSDAVRERLEASFAR